MVVKRDYQSEQHLYYRIMSYSSQSSNVFEYIKQIAGLSNIRNEETGEKLLSKWFDKDSFVGSDVGFSKVFESIIIAKEKNRTEYIRFSHLDAITVSTRL